MRLGTPPRMSLTVSPSSQLAQYRHSSHRSFAGMGRKARSADLRLGTPTVWATADPHDPYYQMEERGKSFQVRRHARTCHRVHRPPHPTVGSL